MYFNSSYFAKSYSQLPELHSHPLSLPPSLFGSTYCNMFLFFFSVRAFRHYCHGILVCLSFFFFLILPRLRFTCDVSLCSLQGFHDECIRSVCKSGVAGTICRDNIAILFPLFNKARNLIKLLHP